MKSITAKPANPVVTRLVHADAQAQQSSNEDITSEDCAKEIKQGMIRFMAWHISELGGSETKPDKRNETEIEAIAEIIHQMKINICLLGGVAISAPDKLVVTTLDDGSVFYRYEPTDKESGWQEANNILNVLKQKNPGAHWKISVLRDDDGHLVGANNQCSCFLYQSAQGIRLKSISLIKAESSPELKLSHYHYYAKFSVPNTESDYSFDVPIASPLVEHMDSNDYLQAQITADVELDENCIFAISCPSEININKAAFNRYRSKLKITYEALPPQGSVLVEPIWQHIHANTSGLVDNPLLLNATDVMLQDRLANWGAMPALMHPDFYASVSGGIFDSILLRQSAQSHIQLANTRIVDLVRACCSEENSANQAAYGVVDDVSDIEFVETGVLVSIVAKAEVNQSNVIKSERDNDIAMQYSRSMRFARSISIHWPVITDICLMQQIDE
ncbi:MAG: hypothetical protein OEZ58_09095 [Gammaproteobacteria bacterium]|nr:hypothetical protein [Gammaproteobacteria bacterium]MDH5729133.1 hypothetical protein [Gammaproteobacteria bacterium]